MPKVAFLLVFGLFVGCGGASTQRPEMPGSGVGAYDSEDPAYHRHHGHMPYADLIAKGFGH